MVMVDLKSEKNKSGKAKTSVVRTNQPKKVTKDVVAGSTTLAKKAPRFKFKPIIKPSAIALRDLYYSKFNATRNNASTFVQKKFGKGYIPHRANTRFGGATRFGVAQTEAVVPVSKLPLKQALFLLLKRTNNNIFMSLTYRNGRPLYQTSGGATGIAGSKRDTPASAETAAKLLVKQVVNRGYTKCYLCIDGVFDNTIRGAVRGLQTPGLISFTKIQHLKTVAHNGVRKSKPRRT